MEDWDNVTTENFMKLAEEQDKQFEETVWPILKGLGWDNPETWERTP